jgi:hypothetical protein
MLGKNCYVVNQFSTLGIIPDDQELAANTIAAL